MNDDVKLSPHDIISSFFGGFIDEEDDDILLSEGLKFLESLSEEEE